LPNVETNDNSEQCREDNGSLDGIHDYYLVASTELTEAFMKTIKIIIENWNKECYSHPKLN